MALFSANATIIHLVTQAKSLGVLALAVSYLTSNQSLYSVACSQSPPSSDLTAAALFQTIIISHLESLRPHLCASHLSLSSLSQKISLNYKFDHVPPLIDP